MNLSPGIFLVQLMLVSVLAFKQNPGWTLQRCHDTRLLATRRAGSKLTPAQRAIQRTIREQENVNDFDKLKRNLYKSVDSLQSITAGKKKDSPSIFGGYSEAEAEALRKASMTPMDLMPTRSLLSASPSVSTSPSKQTDTKKRPPSQSVFDSVKGVVYGTVDAASQLSSSRVKDKAGASNVDSLPVVVDPASVARTKKYAELFPDLESNNPFKRAMAEWKVQDMERKERARKAELERQETLNQIKTDAYRVADTVQGTANELATLPGKLGQGFKSTMAFFRSIPGTIERTVDQVTGLPDEVQKKAAQVEKSVSTSIETTKQAIEDVKAIPNTVQKNAEDAKKNFNAAVGAVNEASTNTKVVLGLEKPKPRPPKIAPPQPPPAHELVLKAAGSIAMGTGKLAFWLGKGLLEATAKGAQAALSKEGVPASPEEAPKVDSTVTNKAAAAVIEPPSKPVETASPPAPAESAAVVDAASQSAETETPPEPPSKAQKPPSPEIQDFDDLIDLDNQVREALAMAAEALEDANKKDKKNNKDE